MLSSPSSNNHKAAIGPPNTALVTTTSAVFSPAFPFAFSPRLPLARMCSPVTASTYLRLSATLPRLPRLRASLTLLICPIAEAPSRMTTYPFTMTSPNTSI